ncbi:HAMP domain-containing sensor histidine kinase [Hydrogenophaga sp. PAMC20947]|uniref:sensor histidine kinase n=1 Tax=Hydrogenophaga sp. PAMC20947 TaxID=2565558 RepID=UPI001FFB3466|nr:HAMP domain-containing sensor histidine kinase [Hydrogenophaga sp. PAMC20947]
MPQPYESGVLRVLAAASGLVLLLPSITRDCLAPRTLWIFSLICWLVMPVLFFWMYWNNDTSPVWLASVSAMILVYYHLTDWRLASLGTVAGALMAWLLVQSVALTPPPLAGDHVVVMFFAWSTGMLLGFSSANLRRVRLLNMLSTMGVMAHELRTPLATVDLLGDVLRNQAQHDMPENKSKKVEELANRLQNLVRSMNRQIDTQISNAQLLRLPREKTLIQAAELVHEVIAEFPYRSSRERDCVEVQVLHDFCIMGSRALFAQMLINLLKNALHSLAASSRASEPGDLRVTVGLYHGKGRLVVADKGLGISHDQQQRIFEPFFSTQTGVGSGLGLTFCKNVVDTVNGHIRVHSEPNEGAVFIVDLPLHQSTEIGA